MPDNSGDPTLFMSVCRCDSHVQETDVHAHGE